MATLTRATGAVATYTVVTIIYLGALSRLTHGAYTPSFYEYQLDRAPDNESTRLVPYVDTALATLALVRATRSYALFFCVAFQVMGLGLRLREGKDVTPDATLTLATVVALATSVVGDIRAAGDGNKKAAVENSRGQDAQG
ncbi:hypothetical protein LEL_04825 [Akanthomyces lecanii RCEF 1005]|uniref:Uncharacterized protein n=1 Tax=Akanthomyces lecanii RCEF 1005 TaxID=1081108 RepID=A0A162K4Y6_CORDF|nr:hypothetical protein LEL_04825 [Akanthomyces lecanii RCEF 1005]